MHSKIFTERRIVKIDGIRFVTTPNGSLVCVLILDKDSYVKLEAPRKITDKDTGEEITETDSMTYEVLRLNSLEEITGLSINKGQILEVEFSYTTIHDIQMRFLTSKVALRPIELPKICPVCSHEVIKKNSTHICGNPICRAKSRTMAIWLMLFTYKLSISDTQLKLLDKYFDNFPLWDGTAYIGNVLTYIRMLKSLETVNVQRRFEVLSGLGLPENVVVSIHECELELMNRFNNGFYRDNYSYLWSLFEHILGDISPKVKSKLNLICPLDSHLSNKILELHLSEEQKDDLISNIDNIRTLFNELTTPL